MWRIRALSSFGLVVVVSAAFLALGLTGWLDSGTYGALTGGVQAIGVVVALALGTATLRSDSRDRRVDRVLALHQELFGGEVQAARIRLVNHMRSGSSRRAKVVSRADLADGSLAEYSSSSVYLPRRDANVLLRFFERANAARLAKAVYLPLYATLIGGHAAWWDKAIRYDRSWPARQHLAELGSWAHDYARINQSRHPNLALWLSRIDDDFEGSTND